VEVEDGGAGRQVRARRLRALPRLAGIGEAPTSSPGAPVQSTRAENAGCVTRLREPPWRPPRMASVAVNWAASSPSVT